MIQDCNSEILLELKKLNQKLDKFSSPVKGAWYNFKAGIFRALGYLFGTVVVASVIIYILSQSKIGQSINNWVQSIQSSTNYQISLPESDQP